MPTEGVALIGDNAQGKSNFLEAIYYLEIFRSFRGAPDRELVQFGEEVFRIEAGLSDGSGHTGLAAAFQRSGHRKKVEVGGLEVDRIADADEGFTGDPCRPQQPVHIPPVSHQIVQTGQVYHHHRHEPAITAHGIAVDGERRAQHLKQSRREID